MLYFLVGLVVVGLGYFVAWPLLAPDKDGATHDTPRTGDESIHQSLADLEFDFTTGKIGDEEYQTARAPLESKLQTEPVEEAQAETAPPTDWELEILVARARRRKNQKSA